MTEYFTESLVLDRSPRGEADESITLYTRKLGKITAVTKSSRLSTSKLTGHLNLGQVIKARIIRTIRFQLVDAISENTAFNAELLRFARFIDKMVSSESPDPHLWHGIQTVMRSEKATEENYMPKVYRRFLEILGYGTKFAKCNDCGSSKIAYFAPSDIIFLCADSLKKRNIPNEEIVSL